MTRNKYDSLDILKNGFEAPPGAAGDCSAYIEVQKEPLKLLILLTLL